MSGRDRWSQPEAFARSVCSPIARPVARLLAPGATETRVLAVGLAAIAGIRALLVAVDVALRRS